MTRTPESDIKAIYAARCHMQGYSDQLNPTPNEHPVTDLLTLTLLVSCYGRNRALQPGDFRDFCDEVRGGPPNRRATGTDIVIQLKLPPEANVRISYREHRIRATLSSPGMMIGTGDMLVLNSHAPASHTTGWAARVGNEKEPLLLSDVAPGLPALLVSTMKRGSEHVMLEYVDEEIPWHEARRTICERITDKSKGGA